MSLCSTVAAYTLIGVADKFQEFFYNTPADVTFKYKDNSGNIQTKTVPNVSKVTAQLLANGITPDQLNTTLTNYYTKLNVDSIINALTSTIGDDIETAKQSAIDTSISHFNVTKSMMTKNDFDANCEMNKRKTPISGQLDESGDFFDLLKDDVYGHRYMFHNKVFTGDLVNLPAPNQLMMPTDELLQSHNGYNQIFNIEGINIKLSGVGKGKQWGTANRTGNYGIDFPEMNLPKVINDTTNTPTLKQGDISILDDLNRNLWLVSGNFSTTITGAVTLTDNNDGTLTLDNNGETGYRTWYIFDYDNRFNGIEGVDYEISFDYDTTSFTGELDIHCYNYKSIRQTNGSVSITFTGSDIYAYLSMPAGSTESLIMSNFKITQVKSVPVVATKTTTTGELYTQSDAFMKTSSVSNTNSVFLEVWHEDISLTGKVYPLGNIQTGDYGFSNGYVGNTLTQGGFTGDDTYSKFGNWQADGELIGYGFVWDNLSEAEKIKFSSDPLNNIYLDGDNIMQVRYRVRVINDITNSNTFYGLDANKLTIGDYYVTPKGANTSIEDDLYKTLSTSKGMFGINDGWTRGLTDGNKGVYHYANTNVDKINHKHYMIPLLTIQRRNKGIFHPRYNPDGCGKIYYNNTDNFFYEVPQTLINSMSDCFDSSNIAILNPTNGDVSSLLNMENNPTNYSGFVIIGTVESKVSGRID